MSTAACSASASVTSAAIGWTRSLASSASCSALPSA